jgi:cytochrome c biogenesis protein CcdA
MILRRNSLVVAILLVLAVIVSYGVIRLGWFLPPGGLSALLSANSASRFVPYLVVISALVDSINPCAFSVLLLTIAFLFSLGKSRGRVLSAGGVYIGGIFLTYLFIGLGVTQALALFGVPHFMAKVGATVLVVWAVLEVLGELVPNFPIQLKIPAAAHRSMAGLIEKGTMPTAFLLGILVGLTEFPCTGGPYLFILGLLHDHATFVSGFWYLILYNLIFVLPLGVILYLGSDRALLSRVQAWKSANNRTFRLTMGGIMLVLGAVIFLFS